MVESALIRLTETLPESIPWSMSSFLSRPTRVLFIPDEPTTLALALIGASILAAYALASRYLRPAPSGEENIGRVIEPSDSRIAERQTRRRRGAA
jgi:hypothetical protein